MAPPFNAIKLRRISIRSCGKGEGAVVGYLLRWSLGVLHVQSERKREREGEQINIYKLIYTEHMQLMFVLLQSPRHQPHATCDKVKTFRAKTKIKHTLKSVWIWKIIELLQLSFVCHLQSMHTHAYTRNMGHMPPCHATLRLSWQCERVTAFNNLE